MKIAQKIRDLHASQLITYQKLKEKVDEFMMANKEPRWHYVSRLKDLESFALKIETGRIDPHEPDDFFACTLVRIPVKKAACSG